MDSLLKYIRRAYDAVVSEQQQQNSLNNNGDPGQKERKGSWLGSLIRSLFETSTPTDDEATAEDIRKTVIHLDTAMRQLSQIFGVSVVLVYHYYYITPVHTHESSGQVRPALCQVIWINFLPDGKW